MEFTLIYSGPLKANGTLQDKQSIRRIFHSQLKKLWTLPPFDIYASPEEGYLEEEPQAGKISLVKRVGEFSFVPLVTQKPHLLAEIRLILLRPESPGSIVSQGGDIDNRLKTLFDALRMPANTNELPGGDAPKDGERPFFCLLEDDKLITKISVETDTLLEPIRDSVFVKLFLNIKTKGTQLTFGNIGLA
ncbi:MAG: hypothetical protein PHP73_01595 [Candidatus Omnitrophica bacterium]|nr:hypothetical protein [Candidatus Omnitrophota bacterium]